ncbi:MAG: hypothetical protein L0Y76_06995 [Ignavibacteria bacterium]|nr:hypothetical protein [Ignavibacteria bacterium]
MIVMKFGGTSVQDAESIDRVCNIVKSRISKKPVVVLSAISKATDTLIQSAELAAEGKLREAKDKISKLKDRHIKISAELVAGETALSELKENLSEYFSDINDLLKGISLLSELSP